MEEKLKSLNISAQSTPSSTPLSTHRCPICNVEFSAATTVCPNDGTVFVGGVLPSHYEITGEIGQGGMGVIYKAHQKLLDKTVAIKMLNLNDVKESSWIRFQQEARSLSNLRHPNIIMIHDFGMTTDGRPYMVMDYVEGKTLSQLLEAQGPMPLSDSLSVFTQICEAMVHAHDAGILHRDLKPANIMIRERAGKLEVTVLDFGIAKVVTDEAQTRGVTQTGDLIGSPLYMSPEQCNGLKLERSSDVYSFGCIMYETLTGKPPITGETALAVMYNQLNNMPMSLKEASHGTEFPDDLEYLVCKTLSKDPASRYQTMDKLLDDLRKIKKSVDSGGKGSKSKRSAAWWSDGTAESSERLNRPNGALPIFGGISVLVVAVVTALYFFNAQSQKQNVQEPKVKAVPVEKPLTPLQRKQEETDANARWQFKEDVNEPRLVLAQISDDGMQGIENCRRLADLTLQDSTLSEAGLARLRALPLLELLQIKHSNVNAQGMFEVSQLIQLKRLLLNQQTSFPFTSFRDIGTMKNLEGLDLTQSRLRGNELAMLSGMQSLRVLSLAHCHFIDDAALSKLPPLPSLRYLALKGTNVHGPGLQSLAKFPALVDVDVSNTVHTRDAAFQDSSVQYLKQLHLTNFTTRDDQKITAKGVEQLCQLPTMQEVRISGCSNVTAKEVEQLQKKYPHVTIIAVDTEKVHKSPLWQDRFFKK